jgi:hypothetical protein
LFLFISTDSDVVVLFQQISMLFLGKNPGLNGRIYWYHVCSLYASKFVLHP